MTLLKFYIFILYSRLCRVQDIRSFHSHFLYTFLQSFPKGLLKSESFYVPYAHSGVERFLNSLLYAVLRHFCRVVTDDQTPYPHIKATRAGVISNLCPRRCVVNVMRAALRARDVVSGPEAFAFALCC